MRKIGVSMRVVEDSATGEWRDAVSHEWGAFLDRLNISPIYIPNNLSSPENFIADSDVIGLMLTGGENPNANIIRCAGNSDLMRLDARGCRDWTESRLLTYATLRQLPVLGVCRGLEVINLFFGGFVEADIEEKIAERHVAISHTIYFKESWLGREVGAPVDVNSFHSQGVSVSGLAPSLSALAQSAGGCVEAIKHKNLPIVGVQWHPERPGSSGALDEDLFRSCFPSNL